MSEHGADSPGDSQSESQPESHPADESDTGTTTSSISNAENQPATSQTLSRNQPASTQTRAENQPDTGQANAETQPHTKNQQHAVAAAQILVQGASSGQMSDSRSPDLQARAQSFEAQQSSLEERQVADLAKTGFYYDGQEGIRCFCCAARLPSVEDWMSEDHLWIEHSLLSPDCSFVVQRKGSAYVEAVRFICQPLENIQTPAAARGGGSSPASLPGRAQVSRGYQRYHGAGNRAGASGSDGPSRDSEGGQLATRRDRPDMLSVQARLRTYRGWPHHNSHSPEEMAEAGFYHKVSAQQDRVECFCCGGELHTWKVDDRPWIEHCRWFPECAFVRQHKEEAFIQAVRRIHAQRNGDTVRDCVESGLQITALDILREIQRQQNEELARMCLHCNRAPREVRLPCGHKNLCSSCLFCAGFWRTQDQPPRCLVCNQPSHEVYLPRRLAVRNSENRRRTGTCDCYQRRG